MAGANDLLGGLIGRAFGGAFAGVIAGGAGGSIFGPPGAIIGAILGGIVGAIGGGEIGEWLFGALNDMGISLASLVDGIADLLRDILSDPIVLDLDGDGIELTALASSATMFDLDDDGLAERTGWVGPHDGLLVHDANGNGLVDGVGELFGSFNVDGYDELATLDANGDGRIDANDPAFAQLLVWRDLDADGVSTSDEMLTLAQAGIARFSLAFTQTDTNVSGNVIARTGTYTRADGTSRGMASVQFALDESGNIPAIPEGADLGNLPVLPNLPGVLALPDLRAAMYFDPTLKAMVEDLVYGTHDFDTFADFRDGGFLDVIYRWAGVDTTIPLEPGDQPYYIQALAAFMGRPFDELNTHQLERLEGVWPNLIEQLGVQFLFQAAQQPALQPFYELSRDLAALDPEDAAYLDSVAALVEATIAHTAATAPAYDYLDLFTGLSLNRTTGGLSGDFDAFVESFLADQPSFLTSWMGGAGAGGGLEHPWFAWYDDQGSLLFHVAAAMGIGEDYVMNVTGWRWWGGEVPELYGTAGNDLLDAAGTLDQRLYGNEGDDELRGNGGVDRLIGGAGDDLLEGGSGSDMYVYAAGDGLDRIVEESGADDTLYFSSEFDAAGLQVGRIAGTNDLLLHFGDPGQGVVLAGQWGSAAAAVEQFHFVAEDGLDAGDVASLYLATLATGAANSIAGSWAGERIAGLDGDDILSGNDGDDSLDGGGGIDTLYGGNHNDALAGAAGNDVLRGGAGNDNELLAHPGERREFVQHALDPDRGDGGALQRARSRI